jgi:hypothetical protein
MSAYLKALRCFLYARRHNPPERPHKRRRFGHWVPDLAGNPSVGILNPASVLVYNSRRPQRRLWIWIAVIIALTWGVIHELNTSELQARIFSSYSAKLRYDVEPGPAHRIVFPKYGPFDERHGYAQIPDFTARLREDGFAISEQANFSAALERIANWGITPPYRERDNVGLVIRSTDGLPERA